MFQSIVIRVLFRILSISIPSLTKQAERGPFREQSSYSTIQFIKMALHYFKYRPEIIQTDNGAEFTYTMDTRKEHPFDIYCREEGILHTLIRPRTPRHNGKVERSHRNDNERFYKYLSFYKWKDTCIVPTDFLYKL